MPGKEANTELLQVSVVQEDTEYRSFMLRRRVAEDSLTQLDQVCNIGKAWKTGALKSGSSWLLWHKITCCLQDTGSEIT